MKFIARLSALLVAFLPVTALAQVAQFPVTANPSVFVPGHVMMCLDASGRAIPAVNGGNCVGGGGGGGGGVSAAFGGAIGTNGTPGGYKDGSGNFQPFLGDTTGQWVNVRAVTDSTATGSLTAAASTVVLNTSGKGGSVFTLGGSWVGTVQFQGSNDGFTTVTPVAAVWLEAIAGQSSTFTSTGTNVNGSYAVITAGFAQIRVNMTAYTSGATTVTALGSLMPRLVVPTQGNPVNNQTRASIAAGGVVAGAALDGWDATKGTTADAPASFPTSTAAATEIALWKALLNAMTSGAQKAQQVDGSGNVMPSADVAARGIFVRTTDGTNTAAVKAASTAPVATDPAAVVSISPNSAGLVPLGQTTSPNSTPVVVASDQSPIAVKGTAGAQAQPVQQVGSANLAQGAVSAATTAGGTLIVAARTGNQGTGRRSVTLWNRTGSDTASCGNTGITNGSGGMLGAAVGATLTLDTQAAIYCIVPTTAQSISFLENF